MRSFELRRRAPRANWFQLVLTLDDDDQDVYPVGTSGQFVATRDADLWAFANDLKEKYGNNKGELLVTVTRVS